MTDSIPDAKLRSRRIPYRRRVLVTPEDKVDRRHEDAFDISMGGMFIATMLPLEVGEHLVCEMEIEHLKFQVAARVAWIRTYDYGDDRPVGMAVKFVDLNPNQKRLLHRHILHHTQGGGELRVGSPPPPGSSSESSSSDSVQTTDPQAGGLWQKVCSIFRR